MKKYMEGSFDFVFENKTYSLDFNGSFVSDNERWLEDESNYNVYYDESSEEVEDVKVLAHAEECLDKHFSSILNERYNNVS